jgi:glycosyltransferase involved in cell wall biosynthesis
MEQVNASLMAQLPSFSVVLETENLANADLNGLSFSLASLENQEIPLTYANEVLLIDSGDVPPNKLEQLREKYPWIKVHQAPLGTGYYQAKMVGATQATGDIVVYCDSDCIYEKNWLRNLLTPFTQDSKIHIVAGETKTRGTGPYGTAMALTYIFPQYSEEKTLIPTSLYFMNNVAFRRDFLLQNPVPTELPLYRGNCSIHAQNLRSLGYTIWKQPQARATHAPPNGLSHFFWRFLLTGYDYYWKEKFTPKNPTQDNNLESEIKVFFNRLKKILADNPRHLIYLPFAIPIVISVAALVFAGCVITRFKSDYLLTIYNRNQA